MCKAAPILLELVEGFMKKNIFELNEESFKRTHRTSNRTKFTRPLHDYKRSFFFIFEKKLIIWEVWN